MFHYSWEAPPFRPLPGRANRGIFQACSRCGADTDRYTCTVLSGHVAVSKANERIKLKTLHTLVKRTKYIDINKIVKGDYVENYLSPYLDFEQR